MTLDEWAVNANKREWVDSIEWDFPEEKMGLGDKLILRNVIEERAAHFEKTSPRLPLASTAFILDVRVEMEKYGYKVRHFEYQELL